MDVAGYVVLGLNEAHSHHFLFLLSSWRENRRQMCRVHTHLCLCLCFVRLQHQILTCKVPIPRLLFKLCPPVLQVLMEVVQRLARGSGRAADVFQCFLNMQLYSLSDFFFDSKLSVIFNLFSGFHLTPYPATAGLYVCNFHMWQTG